MKHSHVTMTWTCLATADHVPVYTDTIGSLHIGKFLSKVTVESQLSKETLQRERDDSMLSRDQRLLGRWFVVKATERWLASATVCMLWWLSCDDWVVFTGPPASLVCAAELTAESSPSLSPMTSSDVDTPSSWTVSITGVFCRTVDTHTHTHTHTLTVANTALYHRLYTHVTAVRPLHIRKFTLESDFHKIEHALFRENDFRKW